MEKQPDRIDNKYKVVKSLGKGAFGEVFLCREGKKCFAVKVLNHLRKKDPERAVQSFKKEFSTLAKLKHPNLAQPVSFGFDSGFQRYFLVTNYIRGKNIVETSERLSIVEIEKIFVQILQALHYLHTLGHGFRHNDIKPSNILVSKTDGDKMKVKLIDFGAVSYAPLRVAGGTAAYAAPENIVAAKIKPGPQSDLYSLGVVWYLCLTGVNPFSAGKNQKSALLRHLQYEPPPPSSFRSGIPSYLDTVILKMLRKNPADRYESAAEIIQDLKILTNKKYSVVSPSTEHRYFSDNEWIEQTDTWRELKRKWMDILEAEVAKPCVVRIIGPKNQTDKILEHFKSYIQTHAGRFLATGLPDDFSTPAAIAVSNFLSFESILQKIDYVLRWNKNSSVPWMILFAGETPSIIHGAQIKTILIRLENLKIDDLKKLMKNAPESFIQNLLRHTNGNPLHVKSVLQAMDEHGLLLDSNGGWHPALFESAKIDFGRLPVPRTLKEAIHEKWHELTPEERKTLSFVACADGHLTQADMEYLEAAPNETIASLLTKDMLEKDVKGRLSFRNKFFKNTVYGKIDSAKKQVLHDRIHRHLSRPGVKTDPADILFHSARGGDRRKKAGALGKLASLYLERGKPEEAIEPLEERIRLLGAKMSAEKADSVSRISDIFLKTKQLKRLETFLKVHAGTSHPAILKEWGRLRLAQKKSKPGRQYLRRACEKLSHQERQSAEGCLLQNEIAKSYRLERNYVKAIELYKQTRAWRKTVHNNDLGYCYLLANKPREAQKTLEEDLKFFTKAKNKDQTARTHYLLGELMRKMARNFSGAIRHYQSCEKFARDLKDYNRLLRAYYGIAAAYTDWAHSGEQANAYPQALRYFQKSLALLQQLPSTDRSLDYETAAVHMGIAIAHEETGHKQKAMDDYQMMIAALKAKKNRNHQEDLRLCEAYYALGDLLLNENSFPESEKFLQAAWDIAKRMTEMKELHFGILLTHALLYARSRKRKAAFDRFRKAKTIMQKFQIKPVPLAQKYLQELSHLNLHR